MFLRVWLYFKKFFEKYFLVFGKCYKEKDKTRKTNTAPKLTLAIDWLRWHSTAIDGVRWREGEIAIDGAISRRQVCDLGSRSTALVLANSVDWSLDVRTTPTGSLSPSCALALSLSLSGIHLK